MSRCKTKVTAQEVVGGQLLDQALDGRKQVKGHNLHLDFSWSRTCPHVLPSGDRNHGRCYRWENNPPTLTLFILFLLLSFISLTSAHGNMHQLHWESEAAVIHVLYGTMATFPWIHSSSTYVGITWYYIGTPETPRRDILQIYTEYKINAYGPKQDRLGFQNQTGSAILTLKDVTVVDEGDYQAQVIRSLHGSSDQVENIKSITRLKINYVEVLNYTLSPNGSRNSLYNFSVDPAKTHIDLPPWGSTVIVPDRFNITVNVSQAGAPQPMISIWKVVNRKNHSQPNCDSFNCNRYVSLTSDDARETEQCVVVIEINFKIQNLKPLLHMFNVSMKTIPEELQCNNNSNHNNNNKLEDLNYTLSLNSTRNSSYNFSVDLTDTHIHLPPWGSTITVPDRFNITVNVSQASDPQPRIKIWKVVNGKKDNEPICDSFYCNRYIDLTSDDAREAQECMVVIEIDFRIQNLKSLIHTFNVSMETAPEDTCLSTDPLESWRGVITGVFVILILLIIVGLIVYKLVRVKRINCEDNKWMGGVPMVPLVGTEASQYNRLRRDISGYGDLGIEQFSSTV